MLIRLILAATLVVVSLPAVAQDAPAPSGREARCLIAGKAFSPGATVRADDKVALCDPSGRWVPTDKTASGCFYADRFYSVGATAGISGKSGGSTCGADGSWTAAPVTP